MSGWKPLTDSSLLEQVSKDSHTRPQVIFKHSTRCSVSSGALSRLNQHVFPEQADFYFLDLIRFRSVSNEVAEVFHIRHESPQIILLWQNQVVYHASHRQIVFDKLAEQLSALTVA
ncbi:MAG: bacillithiol system redox-active protein YtxJ [Dinghuibacter sp.]|nr:bacillithiol system redox-active protein YtxJ [Dinghuibacter sp.]